MNIVKSFFTVGLATAINMLLSFFTTPVITRIVDPAIYGQFNVFTSRVGIVASFLYFGLNDALYRFFFSYKTDEEKSGLLKFCISIPICASLLAAIVAIALVNYKVIETGYSFDIFILFCISVVLLMWNTISMEMLQNSKNTNAYSVAIFTQRLVYCIAAILMLLLVKRNYLLILVIATALSTCVSAIIGTTVTKRYWKFKEVDFPKNRNEIVKYAIPMYIYYVIYATYDVLDVLLVEKYCSDYEVGIYSSAFALVGVFSIVQTAFSIIWRPMQTESYTNNPDDKTLIRNGNRYMTILMFAFGVSVILFKDVLCYFLGEKYRIGSTIIPLLIYNPIMNTLIHTGTSGIEYSKKSYLRTIIIIVSLITKIALSAILIPRLASKGAAIAMSISLTLQYLLTTLISNKYYAVDYGTRKILILILATYIYSFLVSFYDVLIVNIIVYFVYIVILYLLYRKDIKDIYCILLNIFHK